MRADDRDVLEPIAGPPEEAMFDAEVRLRRGEDVALEQEIVVDADGTGDAVLHGDESAVDFAAFHRVEDLLADGKSHRLDAFAESGQQRRLAVRAAESLES